jgi:pilus assembly protein CpaE
MHRNGATKLRVLLSGPAAGELEDALAAEPALTTVRNGNGHLPGGVDVALHVVDDSTDAELAGDVRKLRSLSEAPLILAAYGEPNGIVETGLEVGAADVLVLPQPLETVLFALRKAALVSDNGGGEGKVVTVFSPKGGSGKTVLATNLAVAAARAGTSTLLVDLDLQFGDSSLMLSVPRRGTIADLIASAGKVDGEKLKAFVYTDPRSHLDLLPSPNRPEEAEMVGQAELGSLLDAARKTYDAIVVDTGPLFDGAMIAALDRSDELLLVCNPEVTSLKNVRIGLETIDRLGFPRERVFVVANRLGAAGGVARADIEDALGTEIAFDLPDDAEVPAAVNRATPVVLANESSRFARAVETLAATVFAEAPAAQSAGARRRFLGRSRR